MNRTRVVQAMAIGDIVPIRCRRCKLARQHAVIFEQHLQDSYGILGTSLEAIIEEWWFAETYRVLRCPACGTLAFQLSEVDPDPPDPEADEQVVTTIYPDPRERHTHPAGFHFPSKVRSVYEETVAAFNAGANMLTAVGIRATIEAVCKDKGFGGGSIFSKIECLVTAGYLGRTQGDYSTLIAYSATRLRTKRKHIHVQIWNLRSEYLRNS